jgi:hypothetical protein
MSEVRKGTSRNTGNENKRIITLIYYITKQRVCETISIIKMLTISKNLVWPRDFESFKGRNFNTLSLEFGSVFNKKMIKSVIYLLFSYQTWYIM